MNRILNAIYCDDIRQEINGKYTLVGCYGSHMYLSEFPGKLSKFCAHTTLYIPISEKFSHVRVVLSKGSDEVAEYDFDVEPDMIQELSDDSNYRYRSVTGAFSLPGFEIDEPTIIGITAYIDGSPLTAPRLIVERMSSSDAE